MTDELDPTESARIRRRDRDAEAEARALLRPGMGKVFKQILDRQALAAEASTKKPSRSRTKKATTTPTKTTRPPGGRPVDPA